MAQESLIDRWVKKLSSDEESQERASKILVKALNEDLRDELILAMELDAEAEHLLYEHLAKETRKIAQAKREQAEIIEKLVIELGGEVDKKELESYVAKADGQFKEIIKLESGLSQRLVVQLNIAEDGGLNDAAKTLISLKNEHNKHLEAIESVIMKVNASL
jgi:hypothetical protein